MSRPSVANTLLFWLMLLLGTAGLAPCLALPAWLERQAQIECLHARQAYLAGFQERLQTIRKQIEHLNDDPAYILRLAEQDFGGALKVSDLETVWMDPGPAETTSPPLTAADAPPEGSDQLWPELDVFIDATLRRYPEAQLFVDDRTRPWIMGTGGALIVLAIVLLGLSGERRAAEPASGATG